MKSNKLMRFSQTQTVFQDRPLPENNMSFAGYSALINVFELQVPLPDQLALISSKHKQYTTPLWLVFTPRHKPQGTMAAHLVFALRYEALDLNILKALFLKVSSEEIKQLIKQKSTSKYMRRVWFLYEWLMDKRLNLPDSRVTNFVDVVDANLQYPGVSEVSKRHKVRNNLTGNKNFCPLIRRTPKLENFINMNIREKTKLFLGKLSPDIVSRAAAFLLLKDSKASYAIEGETVGHSRVERWGRAIGQAGKQDLSLEEILRLQKIVIEDDRFTKMGLRKEGGFVGVHDRKTQMPLPEHISAHWKDLPDLIEGWVSTGEKLAQSDLDGVLVATLMAFGFVFMHPLEDGNGRIHRYLIHHVLAQKQWVPKGIVFPVSAVIFERIEEYRLVLEAYSKQRLPLIQWKPTSAGNVEVLNKTKDLYRFFDATVQAEFLYECVVQTVEKTFPQEIAYLVSHDQLKTFIKNHFDMPEKTMELLIHFLRQGDGKLSKRSKEKEFRKLTAIEIKMIENKYGQFFKNEK